MLKGGTWLGQSWWHYWEGLKLIRLDIAPFQPFFGSFCRSYQSGIVYFNYKEQSSKLQPFLNLLLVFSAHIAFLSSILFQFIVMYGLQTQKNRLHVHEYQFELFTSRGELQLKFPCTFFLVWKTGKYSTQDLETVAPEGSVINFNSHLELVSQVAYNELTQIYIEKRSYIEVYLNSLSRANAPKLAGVVPIDLAQVLNHDTYDKPKQYSIERCPDKTSNLTFYIKSKFLRELGNDEIRDISFSFQNQADQMDYIRQTLINVDQSRSPARSHAGVHTQHYRQPSSGNKAVSHYQQNPTRNEVKSIMQGRHPNQSSKDKDGAASRASSRNRQLVSSAVGSIDVDRIKEIMIDTGRNQQRQKIPPLALQKNMDAPISQLGAEKKDRLTWINLIQQSAINRRNEIKDSTMKDEINRWREECDLLKTQLESQKQFRLKLESELEASRMENSSHKGALRDLERKLSQTKELDNSTLKRMRDNLNDYERKLILANDEVERLKMVNSRLESNIESLNRQIQEIMAQHSKQISKLEYQLTSSNKQLRDELERGRRQSSGVQTADLIEELQSTKQKLKRAQDTAYQYRLQIVQKNAALDFAQKNFKSPNDSPFKSKLDDWRVKEIEKLENTIMTKETEINSLKHELSLLHGKLESIRLERRKRSDVFKRLEQISGVRQTQIAQLKQEIAAKNQTISELTASIEKIQQGMQSKAPTTERLENMTSLKAQLEDERLKNLEIQKRMWDVMDECEKKETRYCKMQAELSLQIDQHLKRIEELQANNRRNRKLLQIDNSPVQSIESRMMNEQSLKKLIPFMLSAEVQTDQQPQSNDKHSSKVIQNFMLKQDSPPKSLKEAKFDSPPLEHVQYCFSYLQSPIEYVQLPMRENVEPIPADDSLRIREYELRIRQLQQEIQNKIREVERKNEQLEEMAQLKSRTEQYQQESWNLRCTLEQQLEENIKLKQSTMDLQLEVGEMKRKYQELNKKGGEKQAASNQKSVAGGQRDALKQVKMQMAVATQTETQSLQLQNLELKFEMSNLREKAEDYQQTYNQQYEQLKLRDERIRQLQDSVRKLQDRIQRQVSVSSPSPSIISSTSMMRLSQPSRRQSSLPYLEDTLQQLENVFGGKQVVSISDIQVNPGFNERVTTKRSFQRTRSIAIDPIIEQPEEATTPNDTEHHKLPPTMLVSQLLVLKSKLSHSQKMVDMTMTEKTDRQLIIKYLEEKVNRQNKKVQNLQEELFKTKAHLQSATKKNEEFRSKFLALRPKTKPSNSLPLIKRLSIQTYPSRNKDSEDGSVKNNQSLDIVKQQDGQSARTDPVEHGDVELNPAAQGPLQKTQSAHELECLHAQIDALNEQIRRLKSELDEKDVEVSTNLGIIQQLKIDNFELRKNIEELARNKLDSPVRMLEEEISQKISSSPVTENLLSMQKQIENLRLQNDVFVRMFRNAHAKKEGTASEIDTLRKQIEQMEAENTRLERINMEFKHQIDELQRREHVCGILQSPISRDAPHNFHDVFEWYNQTIEGKDKHNLINILCTRNRILAERLRFVSNDRKMLQDHSKRLSGQIQRVRTKLINDCVLIEQKRDMINVTKPLDTLLKQMLTVFDNPESAVIASEESSEMAESSIVDSGS